MGVESVQMLVGCALPWKRSYRWKRSWRSDIGFIQDIQIFSRKSFDQKDVFNKLRDVTEYRLHGSSPCHDWETGKDTKGNRGTHRIWSSSSFQRPERLSSPIHTQWQMITLVKHWQLPFKCPCAKDHTTWIFSPFNHWTDPGGGRWINTKLGI